MYVCKKTFWKRFGWITQEFSGLRMRNIQGTIFIWTDYQICITYTVNKKSKFFMGCMKSGIISKITSVNYWGKIDYGDRY